MHAPARLLELLEPRQLAHEAIKHAHDAGVALPRADELLLAQVELERLLDPGEHHRRYGANEPLDDLVRVRVRVRVG